MALNTRGTSSSNKTYLNIFQGNIVLEYDTQDALISKLDSLGLEYAEEIAETNRMGHVCERKRTKGRNEGKSVFYYILNDVSGMLTNIKSTVNDFGEFVELEFTDLDETFNVSLGDVYSRICKDFIRRMSNIDLTKELVFGVWNISAEEADNGKAITLDTMKCPSQPLRRKVARLYGTSMTKKSSYITHYQTLKMRIS